MGMTKLPIINVPLLAAIYECGECDEEFAMQRGHLPIYCPFCGKQLDLES